MTGVDSIRRTAFLVKCAVKTLIFAAKKDKKVADFSEPATFEESVQRMKKNACYRDIPVDK